MPQSRRQGQRAAYRDFHIALIGREPLERRSEADPVPPRFLPQLPQRAMTMASLDDYAGNWIMRLRAPEI